MNPRYPVYVVSKGRSETRITARCLERIGVPYSIVVEPQERDAYAAHIDEARVLALPFSNLGYGSVPARNWIWEHACASGAERHWILDDNIRNFYRLHHNAKIPFGDGTAFRIAEDFVDRFANVHKAGFNYESLILRKKGRWPAFYLNTRVYSCILLSNKIAHRWRGRYNEDTDLSIRILKDGHCTILFNTFLADKVRTLWMRGGNMDELYQGVGRLAMAQSLIEQHPDIVRLFHKWGRPQHLVDYRPFRFNRLAYKEGSEEALTDEPDEYGLLIEELQE